jgi:hypothetical protein
MTSQTADMQAVLTRLEKLERHSRRMRQAGLAALVLTGAALWMAQAPSSRTVEAERFVLRDAIGRVRATLGVTADAQEPTLLLLAGDGNVRASLGPDLVLNDRAGNRRAVLTVVASGPDLRFWDASGKLRAEFAGTDYATSVALFDAHGYRSTFGTTALVEDANRGTQVTSVASLVMSDPGGKVIWRAP